MKIIRGAFAVLFVGLWSTVQAQPPTATPALEATEAAAPEQIAMANALSGSANANVSVAALYKKPVNMKLLVLSADGNEPSFAAIKFFLDHIGIPYTAAIVSQTGVPALSDASRGFYQGIVLASGNLGYAGPLGWGSALSATDWTNLDNYQIAYGVRVVSYYTWPEARYGLTLSGSTGYSNTPAAPGKLSLTAAGGPVFPYLVPTNQLDVVYAYYYPSTVVPAAGETTTPIMTISGPNVSNQTVGVTHIAADGRESLAMTFDNSPYLMHSMALNYGIFNWVTKGVFVGQRRVFLTAQSDDFFLSNDMFSKSPAACAPSSFNLDPTFNLAVSCPLARATGADLTALVNWQRNWQAKTQFKGFRLTHAFNGFGSTPDGDAPANDQLLAGAIAYKNDFFWLNHTWDHENLDCYDAVPNSGICVPATNSESLDELQQNIDLARTLGIPNDTASMVTPNISGLRNTAFLLAAQTSGIKYLVSDMSYPDWQPALPNTGVRSPYVNSILYIPRRATSIFYNTKSGAPGAIGSLPDEYNYFYGPNGLLRMAGGAPFFTTNQTYAQIIETESNALLNYMLRGEWYPTMYHQANLIRYSGSKSLFSDLMDATLNKFGKMSNLPVSSLAQTTIGQMMEDRMTFNSAGVNALYVPSVGITLTTNAAAKVPITGICSTGCISYGGQSISTVPVSTGAGTSIPIF